MLIKIKSSNSLFHSIIKNMDDTLASIPSVDTEGDTEDSLIFDKNVSSVNSNAKDKDGDHYPVDKTLAITLIYDELKSRRNTNKENK